MFDVNGEEVTRDDLENKGAWCLRGISEEIAFVSKYGQQLGVLINPGKRWNKYAPDLITASQALGDVKTQNTPFFQARERFGIDPQFAVVFNLKDEKNYRESHPEVVIYYWVDWVAVRFVSYYQPGEVAYEIRVPPMTGVWRIDFRELRKMCASAPVHKYLRRVNDKVGNAKDSYVLDLRNPAFEKVA
jgi:hypothetical protein